MIRRFCLAALAAYALPLVAMAQDEAASFRANNAQVFDGTGGAPLTLPSQAAPPAVVADFLRGEGYAPETVNSLTLESEHRVARTGLTHLRFVQQVGGLTVHGAYAKAALNEDGELVHLIEALAPATGRGVLPSIIDPRQALDAALEATHPGVDVTLRSGGGSGNTVAFTGDDFFYRNPTVTRVAIAMESGVLQEGYLVETWTDEENLLHHTLVGGNGRVLDVELRTNNDSYKIFPEEPVTTPQTIVSGPGAGNAESPIGWLFAGDQRDIHIQGNNAEAYLDEDTSNSPDPGGNTISDGNFVATADLKIDPTLAQNQAVAVQNLFYFNNIIHDKLYKHGFVEATKNFQDDNFGRGGNGSDAVHAEAQDGSGTNNANFSTPSDGSPGRMQMFIWTQSNPHRDGDVDSDIIYHEYCHGLTWRMIGSMSGPMSGAIGEGMSDGCSVLMNDDDVVAEYSYNNPDGIRSERYEGYSRTYGDFTGGSVHFDGEIYAAIIWDLKGRFAANGVALDTLWNYIVGGMNFTPAGPAFEDMRDGILGAASGTGHECLIWDAFATFGVGEGAQGEAKSGGGGPFPCGIFGDKCSVSITESFAVPSECSGGGGGITPTVTLKNTLTSLAENTDTQTPIKVADIVVTDSDGGNNVLSLTGEDAASFEIGGMELYLSADVVLNFESNPQLDVTVEVDDATIGSTPDDSAPLSIAVTDVNEAPTVAVQNVPLSLPENTDTTSRVKVGDIVITDDALGTNNLSLSGSDMISFEIDGMELFLSKDTELVADNTLDVTVEVNDPDLGGAPDDVAIVSIYVGGDALSVHGIGGDSTSCGTSIMISAGSSVPATICGSGFASGASVSFENGGGPAPEASSPQVAGDGATMTLTISAKSGGPPRRRVWDVRVTNPDASTVVLSGGLIVNP